MTNRHEPQALRVQDELLDYNEELTYTYKGERFTGVGYADVPGHGLSEISYVDGAQDGPARDWYPSGQLKFESHYRQNARHGSTREYREDGSLASEEIYEHSVLTRSATLDREGTIVESFVISEDSPNFELLQRLREQFG